MLRRRLAIKLIFYIGITLVLTLGIFSYINIKIQKKYLFEEMQQNAVRLSQTIERSIKYEMLIARSDHIQKTLEDIGKQEGIEHIQLFDKKGKIIAADSKGAIGMLIDKEGDACKVCHRNKDSLKKLPTLAKTRISSSQKGYRVLGIINPIYNEPQCYNSPCHFHPKDQNVLGVMDILMSLARFDGQISTSRKQIVIYFLFTFLLISGGIGFFIFLFVNIPISKMIEGTRKIAEGDLKYQIGSYYSDEIGELGKSFDKMTAELAKSREEMEQWNVKLKNEVRKATEKLRKTNEKLNKANEKLREVDNMKSDFMRRVEHGSRSHLGVIKSCLNLVKGGYYSELNEQQRDLVNTAERRSSALLELLDDILLLSYRKSTRGIYNMESVHIAEIVQKVIDEVKETALKKHIVISVQIPPDIIPVLADRKALSEVFSNLITNAVKYTREHGTIDISAKQKKDFIEIDISDTGIGIASEDLPKIFDEFYRTPNAKSIKEEGTGLGLSIVKEIVEAHHGSIEVRSEFGKGSSFTVILPKKFSKKSPKSEGIQ